MTVIEYRPDPGESDAYTATLQEALPELVWLYELDNAKRTVTYHAKALT